MLSRWKVAVITGLFAFGALSFVLGLFPLLADIFWILWFAGCGACILALVLTVVVPSPRSASNRSETGRPDSSRPEAGRSAVNRHAPRRSAADSADGVSQP
ncbi:hypothetical protein [Brevibacterium sp. UCMA 11754]|uniref:hypothetical protein n=1 Tax=Brevibacterium sp. UCMA 11754 TaxID=2749198 RepID=UPI001F2C8FC7|nr:hypothetical protein [Brevibacterium sp. UCMA 11754]MCF2572253.1 hypothetical protein [Brevibacterium sp. UCMA 11754]